ncbi:transient receptor potential cation channel subfamily M member-like 2 isoform X2 [Convolutriloba macropyga]|uniref:transient receptor potential cation channel subfamily M member-like 2 isoform X2 n=1 Tax=Convolutriloba macropyga TaxID=536237 RepID=UPI003F527117
MSNWNVKAVLAVKKFKDRLDRKKGPQFLDVTAMRGHSRYDHDSIFLKDRCAHFKAKEEEPPSASGEGATNGAAAAAPAAPPPSYNKATGDEDSVPCVGCGYKYSEHYRDGLQKLPPGSLWNRDVHMRKHQVVTHGKLRFVNELEGDSKECEFVTVAHDAHPEGVLSFMANQWALEDAGRPNLIVSVLAGHEASRLTPFQRERIREGLVKAVSTTDSWIITGGTHVGLTKVVGEAVRQAEYREWVGEQHSSVKCIGINTWGTIDNHQAMANWLKSEHHSGSRYEERDKEPYRYKVRQKTEVGQTPLNPNHSYFVLVDNGMRNEPNSEVDVRCGIEEILSKQGLPPQRMAIGGGSAPRPSQRHREKKQIPLVVVVVGGNITSFRAIARSLENGIPVVLCEMGIASSASDIITQSLKVAVEKSDNEKWLTPEKESSIKKMVADAFYPGQAQEGDVEAELKHVIMNINTCIKKENLLTVYKVGKSGTQELDAAILHSLLQGDVAKNEDPLELAVTWNRDDVAASDILSNEMDISQRENMDKLMLRSIMECKTNFVKLFMECGFVMKDFLTAKRLELLYNYAAQSNEVLAWLLKKTVKSKIKGKGTKYTLRDVSRLLRSLTGTDTGSRDSAEGTQVDTIMSDDQNVTKTFDYPFVELCLWAILANRKQMALFFWAHAKEPIMLALIGSKLWSSLAHRLWPGEDVFEPEFEANSQEFQELAVGVIDVCYKTDHELAKRLVEQKSLIWKGKTRMDVAVLANCKFFLATACVQACVEGYWKGNLRCKVLNIVWCLVNPVAINGLDVVTMPDSDDENGAYGGHGASDNEHELEQMGGGAQVPNSQVAAAEHETLLAGGNKEVIDNDRLEHVGDAQKMNNCVENENLEVVFRVPQKHGVDANGRLNGGPKISYFQKAKIFYTAPVTKFITHSTAYIVFLLMYSWMVLNITSEDEIHWMEILVVVLATSYAVEEIRQLVTEDATWSKKLKGYLASEWNIIDVIYLSMIFTAFGLSAIGSMREVSRILYGMVTLLLWLRVIRLYQAIGRLGPLWIMMRKMFKEMLIFITVLLVFLLGYGICTIALIFTQEQLKEKPLTDTLEFVVLIPSLQMFGELFLETLVEKRTEGGEDRNANDTTVFEQNEFQASLTVWLLAAYLLIGNVLILNLLIAIFGHIYEVVAENSTIEWKNEMFLLCQEYSDKPVLPPPLSIFETFYLFFTELCCKKSDENELSSVMLERLRIFESYCASSYRQEKEAHKTLEENIKILAEHADEEMEKINDMINVVDYLRQDLEPQDKKKGNKKKRAAAAAAAQQQAGASHSADKAGGQHKAATPTSASSSAKH